MFSDSVLSCCLLFLASGCCVYVIGKWSVDNFLTLQPEIIAASTGILTINLRSIFNLIAPFYFHKTYSIDPLEVDEEDEAKIELRVAPLFEKFCRSISNFGLIYAVCEAHKSRQTGILITSALMFAESYHALFLDYRKHSREQFFHFLWIIAGVSFGWVKKNHYCTLAYLPYFTAFLEYPPEKGYIWSIRRMINNYMMMAHIILMLEAIREARSVDL